MGSNDKGGFLEGLVLGGLLGAVFGLLYAPQSGDKTRDWVKKVKDENQELIDSTKETTENLIHVTKDTIEEGLDRISKSINSAKEKG